MLPAKAALESVAPFLLDHVIQLLRITFSYFCIIRGIRGPKDLGCEWQQNMMRSSA
jgi:hypothetical protein